MILSYKRKSVKMVDIPVIYIPTNCFARCNFASDKIIIALKIE